MGTINQLLDLSPPPADAPGMFRCALPGFMSEQFENAGFSKVTEQEVGTGLKMNAETYWEMITEVGAPIVAAMSAADTQMREKIKAEVFRKIHEKFPDDNINLQGSAILICGEA
jgi:hypothetical protein